VKTVIVGQGYVGLPIAMEAVQAGHDVIGLDVDEERTTRLASGFSYVEDVSDEVVTKALRTGRYEPTTDPTRCKGFDVAVITVPTPLRDGVPDLRYVEEAGRTLAPLVSAGALVVLESTTYPGTTTDLLLPILEAGSGLTAGADFQVGYSPERIDPGNPTWGMRNTPKLISGIDEESREAVRRFYATFVDNLVDVSTPHIAELAKLLENTFRHVNIALVNELAIFANALQVDLWEAIAAASTKPFGFMPFYPGPGVGGHCLPIDPSYLSWQVKRSLGFSFRFVELANDVNDHMPDYVVRRAATILNSRKKAINGAQVLVVGLAYKRNSGDARESPGPILCSRLLALGAVVRATDLHLPDRSFPDGVSRVEFSGEALAASDLVIIVTDHDAYDWAIFGGYGGDVLDTRHRLPGGPNVEYL